MAAAPDCVFLLYSVLLNQCLSWTSSVVRTRPMCTVPFLASKPCTAGWTEILPIPELLFPSLNSTSTTVCLFPESLVSVCVLWAWRLNKSTSVCSAIRWDCRSGFRGRVPSALRPLSCRAVQRAHARLRVHPVLSSQQQHAASQSDQLQTELS